MPLIPPQRSDSRHAGPPPTLRDISLRRQPEVLLRDGSLVPITQNFRVLAKIGQLAAISPGLGRLAG